MSTRSSAAINILVVDNPRSSPAPCWTSVKYKYSSSLSSSPPPSAHTGSTTLHNNDTGIKSFKLGVSSGRTYNILDATQLDANYNELLATQSISDIQAIVVVINCAAYDPMFQESTSAPLNGDLALYSSLCKASWAKSARMILWIDGRGAFREKVEALDLDKFVSEYKSGANMDKLIENGPKRYEKLGRSFGRETHSLYAVEDSEALQRPGPIEHLILLLESFASEGEKKAN